MCCQLFWFNEKTKECYKFVKSSNLPSDMTTRNEEFCLNTQLGAPKRTVSYGITYGALDAFVSEYKNTELLLVAEPYSRLDPYTPAHPSLILRRWGLCLELMI